MVRHFAAVKDGVVVGSRSTEHGHGYPWCVIWQIPRPDPIRGLSWFATFHSALAGAQHAFDKLFTMHPVRELSETIETRDRVPVGATWRDELMVGDGDAIAEEDLNDEHARRQADVLGSCWRDS